MAPGAAQGSRSHRALHGAQSPGEEAARAWCQDSCAATEHKTRALGASHTPPRSCCLPFQAQTSLICFPCVLWVNCSEHNSSEHSISALCSSSSSSSRSPPTPRAEPSTPPLQGHQMTALSLFLGALAMPGTCHLPVLSPAEAELGLSSAMPYLCPDWWEVPQVGHSSYQTHPQAALRVPLPLSPLPLLFSMALKTWRVWTNRVSSGGNQC